MGMHINHDCYRMPVFFAALLMLIGCGGGSGESTTQAKKTGVNGSYLHISTPDFYFGTNDIGTTRTQNIEIANRGADRYPIKSVSISGADAEEFSTDVIDDVVLNPAEAMSVGITFQPISDGRKFANFVVDYDTIQLVEESVNINEQLFYDAQALEDTGNYANAKSVYKNYLSGAAVTTNKQKAAIKLPVLSESEIYGDGEDFNTYLSAMDLRTSGELNSATNQLDIISTLYPDSYLADDALYLRGYIQLMDQHDYVGALKTLQQLRKEHPDSTYYDTALYSEAIAQHEIGNDAIAQEILLDLRYRHTGMEAFGVAISKDNLVSRLWFDRANEALESFGAG